MPERGPGHRRLFGHQDVDDRNHAGHDAETRQLGWKMLPQQNRAKYVIVARETGRRAMPSTAIRSLFYDSAKSELRVTFVSGRRYVYADVPAEVFEAFNTAESRGTFFNHEIRDRYDYREIRRRSDAYRE
jgi:hypothetical protein